jgi:1-acyl-sn-glycerol-3-phosphate acyltransferase
VAATRRAVKPVLGNDPFERGAASRAPAARPARVRGPSPPPPVATRPSYRPGPVASRVEGVKGRIDRLEKRVDQALDGAEGRLADLAMRTGAASYAEEVRELASRLLPAVRDRLAGVASLVRTFEAPADLDAFGMDSLLPERLAPLLDFLYGSWWRVEVRSSHHLPEGPAVVVANHGGALPWDALVLRLALLRASPPRELRPLLEQAALDAAVAGRVARRLGAVAATPDNAAKLLSEGKLVAVFPEGTRGAPKPWADRYRLQRFGRGGFAKVALRAAAPIVPCAVVGSEEASPAISRPGWLAERLRLPLLGLAPALPLRPLALLPLPSRWSIRFGAPIEVASHGAAAAENPSVVNDLTERTRSTLQRMLDEDLAARKSVFL